VVSATMLRIRAIGMGRCITKPTKRSKITKQAGACSQRPPLPPRYRGFSDASLFVSLARFLCSVIQLEAGPRDKAIETAPSRPVDSSALPPPSAGSCNERRDVGAT